MSAKSVSERMGERWRTVTPRVYGPAPENPAWWQHYLRECFPDGVWMMLANDDPDHTIKEDNRLSISHRITVENCTNEAADVVVFDTINWRPVFLYGVVSVKPLAPGVVLLSDATGRHVRLDGHLTDADRVDIANEGYDYDPNRAGPSRFQADVDAECHATGEGDSGI